MQHFVKIHVSTGLIQGYMEDGVLNKLQSAYKDKSEEVCEVYLAEGSRYSANSVTVSILPCQIIAIEAKFIC
ncbi:MAG TPA: hypothetical protein V6C57_06615 [Coleofasciculaceae cyanobacterium]